MTGPLDRTAQEIQRRSAKLLAELTTTGPQVQAEQPLTKPTLDHAKAAAEEAQALAALLRDGRQDVELAKQASFKLTLATSQLEAALRATGRSLGVKVPDLPFRHTAGEVRQRSEGVAEDGQAFVASPTLSVDTTHYFPGGTVCGQGVPRGWYSIPWWQNVVTRRAATSAIVGVGLGVVATEFYEKVLAKQPGHPPTAQWAMGLNPHTDRPEGLLDVIDMIDGFFPF